MKPLNIEQISEKALSKKITIASFVSAIFVLFIHAWWTHTWYELDTSRVQVKIIYFVEHVLNFVGNKMAVQFFFLLSGFLLFKHLTFDNLWQKLKKRIWSVLIPYFLWNILYTVIFLIIGNGLNFSSTKLDVSISGILKSVFLYSTLQPYWYMAYLIVFIGVSPLILFFLVKKIWGGICLWGVAILLCFLTRVPILGTEWFLIFLFGATVGCKCPGVVRMKIPLRSFWGIAVLVLCAGSLAGSCYFKDDYLLPVIMIATLWLLTNTIDFEKVELKPIFKKSFVIYTLHPLVSSTIQSVLRHVLPSTLWAEFLIWCLYIVGGISIIYIIDMIANRCFPKAWGILCGGR